MAVNPSVFLGGIPCSSVENVTHCLIICCESVTYRLAVVVLMETRTVIKFERQVLD